MNGPLEKHDPNSGRRTRKKKNGLNPVGYFVIRETEEIEHGNEKKKEVIFKSRGPPHSHSHKYSIRTSIFTMRNVRYSTVACSIGHHVPRFQLLLFFLLELCSLTVRRVCINIRQLNIEI